MPRVDAGLAVSQPLAPLGACLKHLALIPIFGSNASESSRSGSSPGWGAAPTRCTRPQALPASLSWKHPPSTLTSSPAHRSDAAETAASPSACPSLLGVELGWWSHPLGSWQPRGIASRSCLGRGTRSRPGSRSCRPGGRRVHGETAPRLFPPTCSKNSDFSAVTSKQLLVPGGFNEDCIWDSTLL